MKTGFTLIELVVVIAIVAVLSGMILFSITQYISKGKDSSVFGNMVVLIPAGEIFYNGNNNSYNDNQDRNFCDPGVNSVMINTISQMPQNPSGACYGGDPDNPSTWTYDSNPAGLCCYASFDGNSWVAFAQEFTNTDKAYCVDSRGVKEETCKSSLTSSITQCPDVTQCP